MGKAAEVGMENRADFKQLAKAYGRAGKALHKAGKLEEAIKYYDKALSNHRHKDYLTPKQKAQAEIKEKKRLEYIDPEKSAAAKAQGNELFKAGDFPGAIKHYTEAIERNPDDPAYTSRLYSNRAACYTKLTEIPHALKDSEMCIKLDPNFVKGYLRKANCLLTMKKEKEAIDCYNEALKIAPDNAEAKQGIQKAYQSQYGDQANMTREEKAQRAMQDPEIQQILADPVMRSILEQMQSNPSSAQDHLKNPEIAQKIMKLANSGILEMR